MTRRVQNGDGEFCLRNVAGSLDDVVTLREAFARCDVQLLLSAVLSAEAGWRFPERLLGDLPRKTLLCKIEASLAAMLEASDVGRRDEDARNILVPREWFEAVDAQGCLRRRLGAALLNVEDAEDMRCALAHRSASRSSFARAQEERAYLAERYGDASWLWSNVEQEVSRLAFEPWSRAVARMVWLPRALCAKERHFVLAHLFWIMTYRGFDVGARSPSAATPRRESGRCAHAPQRSGEEEEHESEADSSSALGGDRACARDSAPARMLGYDREYLQHLADAAAYASYLSWLDMLEVFLRLAECMKGGGRGSGG